MLLRQRLPFVLKFRWKVCVKCYWYFFWCRKQERDWVVLFTTYREIFLFLSTWSLGLVIQTNGTENFGRFGKNGKKVILWKVLLFSRKISTRMNRSIWILPGISGFFHTNGKRLGFLFFVILEPWTSIKRYQKIWCACRAVCLLIKPIAFVVLIAKVVMVASARYFLALIAKLTSIT